LGCLSGYQIVDANVGGFELTPLIAYFQAGFFNLLKGLAYFMYLLFQIDLSYCLLKINLLISNSAAIMFENAL